MKLTRTDLGAGNSVKRESEDVPSLVNGGESDSPLSELSDLESPSKKPASSRATAASREVKLEDGTTPSAAKNKSKQPKKEDKKEPQFLDPEADGEEEADEEEIQAALSRPPPVNSDYLPLPWKGRLGYVSPRERTSRPAMSSTNLFRPAYVLIYGSPTLPSSALEHVELRPYSKIGILSKTQANLRIRPRIDPTETNPQILLVVRLMSKVLVLRMRRMSSK